MIERHDCLRQCLSVLCIESNSIKRREERTKEVLLGLRKQYSGGSKPSMRVKMNARGLDATTVDQTFVILWRNGRLNTVATGRPKNQ